MHVPSMTGSVVSHNSEIPAFESNLVLSVQAGDTENKFFALAG